MRSTIFLFLLLTIGIELSAKTPFEEWREMMVRQGRKELSRVQQQNAVNDASGLSELNTYLVVISPEAGYPDGEFIKQRKGAGQGAESGVEYVLDAARVNAINDTLRIMNNASEVKTYLLLVHFIPLEFVNEVPDNLSLTEFFRKGESRSEMVNNIGQPMSTEAGLIVRGITNDELSKATTPTLYCGFVNFRIFSSKSSGVSQWVYYPENSKINFATEYKNMLTSAVSRAKWPDTDISKVNKLVEIIKSNNSEYFQIKNSLTDLILIDNPNIMEQRLTGLSLNALSAFDIGLRVHILKVLSSREVISEREKIICRLIETVQKSHDANQLITAMSQENDKVPLGVEGRPNRKKGWCLLKCITEETNDAALGLWGAENYQRLIKSFISLSRQSSDFKEKTAVLGDSTKDLIATRSIFYNYNSMWVKLAATVAPTTGGGGISSPVIDRSTDYNGCELQTKTELFFTYVLPKAPLTSTELDPFEPIVFVNQSDLGMLGDIDNSNIFISPAILLKYVDEKAWNQTASDATMAAIDAASLATGYGEIKAGVSGMRKAWVIMDMANSGANLALNATLATKDSTVRAWLNIYNVATGASALSRMGNGGVKSLYRAVRGNQIMKNGSIIDLIKALDAGGDDVLKAFDEHDLDIIQKLVQKLKNEASIRGLSNIEMLSSRVLARIAHLNGVSDEVVNAFKSSLKTRIADEGNMTWNYTDNELKSMILAGKKINIPDKEIEDIIFNGCRNVKTFKPDEVISQINYWSIVKQRGYPNLFTSLKDYDDFSSVLKKTAGEWGLPENSIFVQGSTLRVSDVSKIGDIDVAIKVDANTFDKLIIRFGNSASATFKKVAITDDAPKGIIRGGNMHMDGVSATFTGTFYTRFKTQFGVEYGVKFPKKGFQISIIKTSSRIDVSPYLNIK